MKWINAGERMPKQEFATPIIFRRVGDNNTIMLGCGLFAKLSEVEIINQKKIAEGKEPYKIDMTLFEWLDESSEEDVVWVIYDTLRGTFLDKGDFFQKGLKYAKTFSSEIDAESAKNSYIKIYKDTNRKETTEFLETIPVGLQIILKRQQ